jgi:NAD(P)-dependent dehydrogenase (short-subunit alcohol dehydrogenase family)
MESAEWSLTNALRPALAEQNIRVAGLHVGFMDTDMAASVTGPKANPADIADIALDGIEAGAYEIAADKTSRQILAGLSGGVAALYPQFS